MAPNKRLGNFHGTAIIVPGLSPAATAASVPVNVTLKPSKNNPRGYICFVPGFLPNVPQLP